MRFIGSKVLLLENIERVIDKSIVDKEEVNTFCDIFSGTSVVARYFKPRYRIISNDMLYFSYVLQMATIHNNKNPDFSKLRNIGIENPINFLENENVYSSGFDDSMFFIYQNYSPNQSCDRMYFTPENAKRIDFIRLTIEKWYNEELIDDNEYFYLIMCLLEGVPYISNTTGTYGAYLKHWDKRAFKKLKLIEMDIIDNSYNNKCFNKDSNLLIKKISGDILYIDPPYNRRQYMPNYHLLETIAKYDNPEIYGKTGLRPYREEKSDYCNSRKVKESFRELIKYADFKYIIVSYSTDGLMSINDIEEILKEYCKPETYKLYKFPYRKYKSKHKQDSDKLSELIFFIEK